MHKVKGLLLIVSLGLVGACGNGAESLMTFEVTFQLISDCSQAGTGNVFCEKTENVVKARESGTWFFEPKEAKTFILTNHLGEAIKGVGPFEAGASDDEEKSSCDKQDEDILCYQARKYEEEVDTGDGCHSYTDELYNIFLNEDGALSGDLTIARTGGSKLESAGCGLMWAHEIVYELKGAKSDELVPARQ